jgi:hypothetical protein
VGELELAHLVRRHQRDDLLGSFLMHHLACLVGLGRRRAGDAWLWNAAAARWLSALGSACSLLSLAPFLAW